MHLVHLTASTFFGGPERQMLGLATHLSREYRTTFLSFSEQGKCRPFLAEARHAGFEANELEHDTPDFRATVRALANSLRNANADVLLSHGYKANMLGRIAARRVGIPIIGVSRGWTGETLKVRCYDALDRMHLRWLDRVVCVSEGQAQKVRKLGVPESRVRVIRNAARLEAFQQRDPLYRERWNTWTQGGIGILAAGRLSKEKGFLLLAQAAKIVRSHVPNARFVLFGAGPEQISIEAYLRENQMTEMFHLVGFRRDLDSFLPWASIVALPSYTEGLPNIVMEAASAGVPVVATAVGGTPEAVRDGTTGYLVASGDAKALAEKLIDLCNDPLRRQQFGAAGRAWMQMEFSFAAQARAYEALFDELEDNTCDRFVEPRRMGSYPRAA
jgi:glycosyltransferase involved in cell wall biosynthesis